MKTIQFEKLKGDDGAMAELCRVLQKGNLVCIPCGSSYRIVADLTSAKAVSKLLQSKRRTRKAPSLVFVSDEEMLSEVVETVDEERRAILRHFWPSSLTILFDASDDLPRKVVKPLTKANGRLGVRIPDDPIAYAVVEEFGRPLLVSSANKEKKHGAGSPAQVRKNFFSKIALFVDAGDLPPGDSSTVVDLVNGELKVLREGAVKVGEIERVLAS